MDSLFQTRAFGKFLLTGEYFVMDGALALAIPLRFGQRLQVTPGGQAGKLGWESRNPDGSVWFDAVFSLPDFAILQTADKQIAETLAGILRQCYLQRPLFFAENQSFKVFTQTDFPREWGLGTSSTLIAALSRWCGADPYAVLFNTLGGSGYDIACAYADGPVLYRLSGQTPEIIPVVAPLFEAFSAQLYFIYSGKKQNSREGIARYRALKTGGFHPEAIEKLTLGFLNAKTLTELETVIREHEMLVGEALQLSPVKAQFFQDYWGEVKSLGAWGGDFVLATSERPESETRTYFQQKGFNVVKPWKSMV